jgi:hypothetical protein
MGKDPPIRPLIAPSLPHVAVSAGLKQRVWAASRAQEMSVAQYVRTALLEKLERDGK